MPTAAHLARAALEAVAYQTLDLVEAMAADGAPRRRRCGSTAAWPPTTGCASSSPTSSSVPVERPANLETTALGAAFHAGLATGVWPDLDALAATRAEAERFEPKMANGLRRDLLAGWKQAVARALSRPD